MKSANPQLGSLTRWIAPGALAVALGLGAMTPAPAHAQDALTRVLVDVADVVINNGAPYDRHGEAVPSNRLVVGRDAYGRPTYYRQASNDRYSYQQRGYDRYGRPVYDGYGRQDVGSRDNEHHPHGNAYGYYRHHGNSRCDQNGDRCWNEEHHRHHHDDDGDRDEQNDDRDGDQGDDD